MSEIYFTENVSSCDVHALCWLDSAYESLADVDMKSILLKIGYTKCWEHAQFRMDACAACGVGSDFIVPEVDGEERIRNRSREDDIMQDPDNRTDDMGQLK